HLSSRRALDAVREGKRRARVFSEARPLYLYLTRAQFDRPDAALWVGQPPLREADDVDAVWSALADGTLDTVGTDHIPHTRAAKLAPGLAFDKIPPGVSNRSEEHTSELQSLAYLVCRLLLEKKKKRYK